MSEESKKSFFTRKKILFLLTLVVLCVFGFITSLPTIFSSNWGRQHAITFANQFIPGSVQIEKLQISWFGPQEIEGIELLDPSGNTVATVAHFKTDASLLDLINKKLNRGFVHVTGLNANIIEHYPGTTNLQLALLKNIPPLPATHRPSENTFHIGMENVNAKVNISSAKEPITLHLEGQTKQGDLQGNFDVDVMLSGIASDQLQRITEEGEISLKANIQNFPVAIVDYLIGLKHPGMCGIAAAAFGKTLNMSAQNTFAPDHIFFELQAQASTLSTTLKGQIQDGRLLLKNPGTIAFTITPEFVRCLARLNPDTRDLRLQKATNAQLTIQELGIPLTTPADQFLSQISLEAQLSIDQASLIGGPLQKGVEVQNMQATVQVPLNAKPAVAQFQGDVTHDGHSVHTQLNVQADVQNNTLNNLQGQLAVDIAIPEQSQLAKSLGDTGQLVISTAKQQVVAEWTSPLAKGKMKGSLSQNGLLSINEPITIAYTVSQETAKNLGLLDSGIITLDKPTTALLTINPPKQSINLKQLGQTQLDDISLTGQLSIKELLLTYRNKSQATIRNLSFPWEVDGLHNRIQLSLQGETQLAGNQPGSLSGNATITHWLNEGKVSFKDAQIQSRVQLNKLPVVFFGAVMQHEEIVELLGSTIDLDLTATNAQFPIVDIALRGNGFQGQMSLVLAEAIELQNSSRPATLSFTFTPEKFQTLRRLLQKNKNKTSKDPLVLVSPATVKATISSLNIPWNSASNPAGWTQAALNASLEIDGIQVRDSLHNQAMHLEKIVANIDTEHLAKMIHFNAEADEKTHTHEDNETTLSGTLENAFTSAGAINKQDLSLQLEANSRRLPAGLLCHITCSEPGIRDKVEALFGPTVDTDIKISLRRMSGPVQAHVRGKNGSMNVDAMMGNGILTLRNPLEVQVAVTPQLSRSILQDVIPILGGAIAAEHPIRITIDPQGFAVPVRDWDITDIKVGRATIDLGKIQFTGQGELGNIFALLRPSTNDALSVWFTPLYLSISDGVLQLNRMDMLLLNRYPIVLWGKIHFPKDKVDLTIGLTGTALSQALNLEGLDSDYMMQLPFKGSIGDASIDKTKATARISALVAQQEGGPHGVILGTVLDIAGGSLTDKSVPEPTTKPLPWAGMIQQHQTASSSSKQESKHHSKSAADEAVKAIEKGAGKLLDSIFH